MFERERQRAESPHRQSLNGAPGLCAQSAVGLLNERDQVLNDRVFVSHTVFGIQVKAVLASRSHDNEFADFSFITELGDGGCHATTLKLPFVSIHPVQEIEHWIAPFGLLFI